MGNVTPAEKSACIQQWGSERAAIVARERVGTNKVNDDTPHYDTEAISHTSTAIISVIIRPCATLDSNTHEVTYCVCVQCVTYKECLIAWAADGETKDDKGHSLLAQHSEAALQTSQRSLWKTEG